MREPTYAGVAAARARGRLGGRPSVMTPAKIATASQMYNPREHTVAGIAATLGVSRATIYRNLAQSSAAKPTLSALYAEVRRAPSRGPV